MTQIRSKFRTPLTLTALAAALACGSALAQEAATMLERVEVTGSNIKRLSKETSSPIDVITSADIKASGAKTVLELMRMQPTVGTDGFNDSPQQNSFSRGVATVSLRSMGSTSTLVLLNGRRMTPSAYANPNNGDSTLYDLNSLPLSAIERVEILKDGASAVYGSDAMAGVVNFITKKDYQGLELGLRTGANDDGKFGKHGVNITAGFGNYASDGYNFLFSADLSRRDRTMERDVMDDVAAADYAAINLRLNPYSSIYSKLPFFTREGSPGVRNFTQTFASVRNITEGCDPAQLLTGNASHGITSAYLLTRSFCNFDVNAYNEVQTKGQDANIIGRATFKLSESTQAFAELALSQSDRRYLGAPRTINGISPTTNYLLGGLAPPFQAILEIGHPDNPFNSDPNPSRAAVQLRAENFPGGSKVVSKGYRAMGGVRGTVGEWDWETAVLWNRSDNRETLYGMLRLPVLRTMLGETTATTGRPLAEVMANPDLSRPVVGNGKAEILQWDAKVSTEFSRLPGGKIGLAAGVEFRRESLGITPDAENAAGNVMSLANTAVDASRNVKSAFVELRTPFLKQFEMDFAGRLDKYPGLKTNFVPKVGAKWTVTEDLALRSTFAKGFRAAALSQIAAGGTQFFASGYDPMRCKEDGTPKTGAAPSDCPKSFSGVSGANADLKPERSRSLSLGLLFSPRRGIDLALDWYRIRKEDEIALSSTEDVLNHPERYGPTAIVRETNAALLLDGVPGTGPLLSVTAPWVNQGATEVSGLDFDVKASTQLGELGKWTNRLGGTYTLKYSRVEIPGFPENNLVGTYGGLSDWATTVGDVPRLKMRFSSTLDTGMHRLMGAVNFISGISFFRNSDGSHQPPAVFSGRTCHWGGPNFDDPELLSGRTVLGVAPTATNGRDLYINRYPGCAVPKWVTFDLGYTYTGIKNLSIGLNIANVLDEKAPYYPASNTSSTIIQGGSTDLHSNTGRYFTLTASYTFK